MTREPGHFFSVTSFICSHSCKERRESMTEGTPVPMPEQMPIGHEKSKQFVGNGI